jgi:hypothetical protein
MRILIGKSRELKSSANFRTDANELTSNSRTSKGADGVSFNISSFTASPFWMFRTPMMICPPRFANTRAVSFPIPAVAPVRPIRKTSRRISLSLSLSLSGSQTSSIRTYILQALIFQQEKEQSKLWISSLRQGVAKFVQEILEVTTAATI